MRYKIGDKIKIRSWQDMEEEYGTDYSGNINNIPYFMKYMEELLKPDRIVTITYVTKNGMGYYIEEDQGRCRWVDWMIKSSNVSNFIPVEPDISKKIAKMQNQIERLDSKVNQYVLANISLKEQNEELEKTKFEMGGRINEYKKEIYALKKELDKIHYRFDILDL